jgi:cellulose synthase/poly-beta-1,6-N-acetylglucosamine synthase-like glycosyltransferase
MWGISWLAEDLSFSRRVVLHGMTVKLPKAVRVYYGIVTEAEATVANTDKQKLKQSRRVILSSS